MEKKTQIYLSGFAMSAVVGFAGYINQFSSYWVVFILSILIAGYALSSIFTDKELFNETKFNWISICAFLGLEVLLTVLIGIAKLPYVGFFKYFNYGVQLLGIAFMIYYVAIFIISFANLKELLKEKLSKKEEVKHDVVVKEETTSNNVEEVIQSEENVENDVEVFEETISEPQVMEIGYKKEKEIDTPYMEEEL